MDYYFDSGVNFDYIIAIKVNKEGLLEKFHYPINYHKKLKDTLYDMLNDEIYDIFDMDKVYRHEITSGRSFNQCIGHEYLDAYISTITNPHFSTESIKFQIKNEEERILTSKIRIVKKNNPKLRESEVKKLAKNKARQAIDNFHYDLKEKYLQKRVKYIEASAYELAYKDIKDKVIFLSTERHGWKKQKGKSLPSWEYNINEDLIISLWSNFCYGSSSRFLLQVYYKGIMLCPYSEFVTYRYANTSDIISYTRKFHVKRSSWEYAANFVESFCNGAIDNPDKFVKKEILYEINTLVKELTDIATSKEQYLKNAFDGKGLNTKRFSGVKGVTKFNNLELKKYNDNPTEYELLFRVEKISGALAFLDSMEKFISISSSVKKAIAKIEELNIEIYPELVKCIKPLSIEVDKLHAKYLKLKNKKEEIESELDCHYKKIEKIRNRYSSYSEKEKHEDLYRNRHPELEELEANLEKAEKLFNRHADVYRGRKNFLKKLLTCQENIEDSGVLDE